MLKQESLNELLRFGSKEKIKQHNDNFLTISNLCCYGNIIVV